MTSRSNGSLVSPQIVDSLRMEAKRINYVRCACSAPHMSMWTQQTSVATCVLQSGMFNLEPAHPGDWTTTVHCSTSGLTQCLDMCHIETRFDSCMRSNQIRCTRYSTVNCVKKVNIRTATCVEPRGRPNQKESRF